MNTNTVLTSVIRSRMIQLRIAMIFFIAAICTTYIVTSDVNPTLGGVIGLAAFAAVATSVSSVCIYRAYNKKSIQKALQKALQKGLVILCCLFVVGCSECRAATPPTNSKTNAFYLKLMNIPGGVPNLPGSTNNNNSFIGVGYVVGFCVLVGGAYMAVQIWDWADKLVTPPASSPSGPSCDKHLVVSLDGTVGDTNCPLFKLGAFPNTMVVKSYLNETNYSWKDYSGDLILYYQEAVVTNVVKGNQLLYWASSTNLTQAWTPETFKIKSWRTWTNLTCVAEDKDGKQISVAWLRFELDGLYLLDYKTLNKGLRIPFRHKTQQYYTLAPGS